MPRNHDEEPDWNDDPVDFDSAVAALEAQELDEFEPLPEGAFTDEEFQDPR